VPGPLLAAVQGVVDPRSRAVSVAVLMLGVSLVGFGLGPLGIGVLSDLLQPSLGNESLRWALVVSTALYAWAALHLWLGAHSYVEDMRHATEERG